MVSTSNKYMATGPSGARCQEWPCRLTAGSKLLLWVLSSWWKVATWSVIRRLHSCVILGVWDSGRVCSTGQEDGAVSRFVTFARIYTCVGLRRHSVRSFIFWDITPFIPVKVHGRFWGIYYLYLQGWRVSQERNHVARKQSATSGCFFLELLFIREYGGICSSETSVDFHGTSPRYITEDRILHTLIFDTIADFMVPNYWLFKATSENYWVLLCPSSGWWEKSKSPVI
jgi:hypothetical protein